MNKTTNKVRIADWLFVGDMTACDEQTLKTHTIVHIYRDDFAPRCQAHAHDQPLLNGSIILEYKDGDPITEEMFQKLETVIEKALEEGSQAWPRPVLVHCHAGACRSPIIAAYILSRVSCVGDIFEAIAEISRAIWEQRGVVVNITHKPLKSILERKQ